MKKNKVGFFGTILIIILTFFSELAKLAKKH